MSWHVVPKVSMKTTMAMNQCYITVFVVAADWTSKGWHERRRQRVCSLPFGESFSELLSRPKHTQLWWLSICMPLCLDWFPVPASTHRNWSGDAALGQGPLTDSDNPGNRMVFGRWSTLTRNKHLKEKSQLLQLGCYCNSFGQSFCFFLL